MKSISVSALTVAAALLLAGNLSAMEIGEQGPNFEFEKSWNFPGGETQLEDFRGRIAMIESWATW